MSLTTELDPVVLPSLGGCGPVYLSQGGRVFVEDQGSDDANRELARLFLEARKIASESADV